MKNNFYERFNIPIDLSGAQRHFMNRIKNIIHLIIDEMHHSFLPLPFLLEPKKTRLLVFIANRVGKKFHSVEYFERSIDHEENFLEHLHLVEALYVYIDEDRKSELAGLTEDAVSESAFDLGIVWRNGRFYRKGAPLLDKKLINESLGMLRDKKYENVIDAFEKGLDHFIHSQNEPERLIDAITDVYEALEALAKVICGNNKDLSANRDLLIKEIDVPEFYRRTLKEYVTYACKFRHALKEGKKRKIPSEREVETFIYLSGIYIRLALQSK